MAAGQLALIIPVPLAAMVAITQRPPALALVGRRGLAQAERLAAAVVVVVAIAWRRKTVARAARGQSGV